MKKKVFNYIIATALTTITLWILFSQLKATDISYLIKRTNKYYILLAVLSMIGYWLTDAAIIKEVSKKANIKCRLINSLKLTMIGQYYTAITPFAIGCQPAQIYNMAINDVSAGAATSVFIDKFIIYQVVESIYSAILLLLRFGAVQSMTKALFPFIVIGMIIRFLGTLAIMALFLYPALLKKIILFLVLISHKIKVIKNVEKYEHKLLHYFDEYSNSIKRIKTDFRVLINASAITLLQLTFYFSITYFIYISLGYNKASYLDIVTIQAMLYMTVSFIPIPGTVGAAEGGFYLFFESFFSSEMLVYATLLWRIISYYFNLLICGSVVLTVYLRRHWKSTISSKLR